MIKVEERLAPSNLGEIYIIIHFNTLTGRMSNCQGRKGYLPFLLSTASSEATRKKFSYFFEI